MSLSQQSFNTLAESNPQIPREAEQVLQWSRALAGKGGENHFTTLAVDGNSTQEEPIICGESLFGALFAALQNPDLDEAVLNQAVAELDAAVPTLPTIKELGHFRFQFTKDDTEHPGHNVTENDIDATAKVLNDAWDDFAVNFAVPKHRVADGKQLIDVRIYDLPQNGLYGVTSSTWDHIELDSIKVVRDPCRRQTTPVHELFHRVQYAFGYVSGTAEMRWAVEATAAWSQKHRAASVGDWLDRMDAGFESAEVRLRDRSYDAIPLWVYLGQRIGNEAHSTRAAWSTYQTNGKNMLSAIGNVLASSPAPLALEQFLFDWHWANLRKDYNPQQLAFDYIEDDFTVTCGADTHGPLAEVTPQIHSLNVSSTLDNPDAVAEYAADYHHYSVQLGVQKVKLKITPKDAGKIGMGVLVTKGKQVVKEILPSPEQSADEYTIEIAELAASDLFVVLTGTFGAQEYRISVVAQ